MSATFSYILPANWASYLINRDGSGLDDADIAQADSFLKDHGLPAPCGCSDGDAWFARSNDASNQENTVLEYYFSK